MKDKNRNIALIIAGVLVVGLIIFLLVRNQPGKDKFNWSESYWVNRDQPFSTSIIKELLEDYFPDNKLHLESNNIYKQLTDTSGGHKTYMFIGDYMMMADSVIDALSGFVYRGNDAFIAAESLPEYVCKKMFPDYNINLDYHVAEKMNSLYSASDSSDNQHYYSSDTVVFENDTFTSRQQLYDVLDSLYSETKRWYKDTTVWSSVVAQDLYTNFTEPSFKAADDYHFRFQVRDTFPFCEWLYFNPALNEKYTRVEPLGTISNKGYITEAIGYNYIRVRFGDGHFLIHTDPLLFTNFYQVQKENIPYTSKVFSYLQPGDIIWDEYSRYYHYANSDSPPGENEEAGPLQFIMSQRELRWAWYVLLAGLLLFMIFRSKRVQRIIPVAEANINKSLEFVQTIGRMYFLQKDNKNMAGQKIKLFQQYIKDHYQLVSPQTDAAFITKVSLKSQIPENDIKEIFNYYRSLEKQIEVTDRELIALHQLLAHFYKNSK